METLWQKLKINRNIPNHGIIKIKGTLKFYGNSSAMEYGANNFTVYDSLHIAKENGELFFIENVKVHTKIQPIIIGNVENVDFYFLITEGTVGKPEACILIKAFSEELSIDIVDEIVATSKNLQKDAKFQGKLLMVQLVIVWLMFFALIFLFSTIIHMCAPILFLMIPHIIVVILVMIGLAVFTIHLYSPGEALIVKEKLLEQLRNADLN